MNQWIRHEKCHQQDVIENCLALIKIGSHRARQKVKNLLGRLNQFYYSWPSDGSPSRPGSWMEVTIKQLDMVKEAKIKGVTQSRWRDDLCPCINWY